MRVYSLLKTERRHRMPRYRSKLRRKRLGKGRGREEERALRREDRGSMSPTRNSWIRD